MHLRIQSQIFKQHLADLNLFYINYNSPDCLLMARTPKLENNLLVIVISNHGTPF